MQEVCQNCKNFTHSLLYAKPQVILQNIYTECDGKGNSYLEILNLLTNYSYLYTFSR